MTHHDCPYCSGSGTVAHDGDLPGLDDGVPCPLCDGSGRAAEGVASARGLGRVLRGAARSRQGLLVVAGLACGGVILLAIQLLGSS